MCPGELLAVQKHYWNKMSHYQGKYDQSPLPEHLKYYDIGLYCGYINGCQSEMKIYLLHAH